MTFRVSSEAERDYEESLLYYLTEETPQSAERFEKQVEIAYRDLQEAPYRNRIAAFGLREKRVKGFPFSVLYLVDGDEIFVEAIYHDDRKRSKLKRRM
jgi:plasmid stabilization system protein ParE